MTANHEHTPTVLDEMRTAFAMRHWHKTDDFKAGQRIFDDQIAAIEAAAEQRGAIKALREAADTLESDVAWHFNRNQGILIREDEADPGIPPWAWLKYRADQMEGDDEYSTEG